MTIERRKCYKPSNRRRAFGAHYASTTSSSPSPLRAATYHPLPRHPSSKLQLAKIRGPQMQKALFRVPFVRWCAIVCDYRTNFYDEYKQLGYKLELLLDQDDQQETNNLQLLLA